MKVLIADDSVLMTRLIGDALSKDGHELLFAKNGTQAVEMTRLHQPDLVIMDGVLPVMDGYEACRSIKADPATASIPVIMVTSQEDEEHIRQGFMAGSDDFIAKPFTAAQLRSRVSAALAIRKGAES